MSFIEKTNNPIKDDCILFIGRGVKWGELVNVVCCEDMGNVLRGGYCAIVLVCHRSRETVSVI